MKKEKSLLKASLCFFAAICVLCGCNSEKVQEIPVQATVNTSGSLATTVTETITVTETTTLSTTTKITTTSSPTTITETKANQSQKMVWIPKSGSKYHRRSGCSKMKNPSNVSLSKAEALGYTPCKKCY